MPVLGSFYGLQARALKSDRLYKIYVSEQALACAYIAGQFYDENAAARQLQSAGIFLAPLVRKWLNQRQALEQRYDAEDPFSALLLHQDPRNLQIIRSDVVQVWLDRRLLRGRLRGMPNAGSVTVELANKSRVRWFLIHDQNPDDVMALLRKFWPDAQVIGKPPITIQRDKAEAGDIVEFGTGNQRFRLDGEGIWQLDPSGKTVCFIDWQDLRSIGRDKIIPKLGRSIRVQLPQPWQQTFLEEANQKWRGNSFAAWKAEKVRNAALGRRLIRFWIPLGWWTILLVSWVPRLAFGINRQANQNWNAVGAVVIVSIITVVCWSVDFFYLRKQFAELIATTEHSNP
jgi:hypothetical protein